MSFARPVLACVVLALAFVCSSVTCQEPAPADKAVLDRATKSQTAAGYNADEWKLTNLKPGDVVYGGVPGQTEYYTTKATLDASELNAVKLFKSLQVRPHPTLGYRVQVRQYTVQKMVAVPFGKAAANPKLGPGGGDQYFIAEFKDVLEPGPVLDLMK
jgi:hypothetical protein